MAQVNLSVPHSTTQKAGNFWRNLKPVLPFVVLLILVVFAQTYFQQIQETRTKAAGNILNAANYGSIQKAIDAAQPGDSIYVPAGTWEGTVNLNGRSNLTIYGDGGTSVIQVTKSADTIFNIGGTNSSNIVVHDLMIKGAPFNSDNYQCGIQISKLATGHFYNIRFESIGYAAICANNGEGDWTIDITNIEVDHNTVVGPVGEHGFYVGRGSQYWNMHHNTVGQCIGYSQPPHAFYIQDSSYVTVQYNNANDTTTSNGFAYKFGQDEFPESTGKSHDNVCNYNTGNHNFGGIWVVASNNFTARGNVITNNYNSAIQFYDVSNTAYIDGNDMNPGMYGMQFIFNGLWGSGSGNPTNIHLTNNNLRGGGVWGCPNNICPSGMIVEQTNNSWQPGYVASPSPTLAFATPTPTSALTPGLTATPTSKPTLTPTPVPPTATPTPRPTSTPTPSPSPIPTNTPTPKPTTTPTPTPKPTIPPTLTLTNTPTPAPQLYEAENAAYYGAIFSKQNRGYTGTGYIDYQHNSNDYIQWTVNVPTSGPYLLGFRYANGSWHDRPLQVKVNGITVNTGLSFPRTGKWTNWKYSQFVTNLNAGKNTIRLTAIRFSGPNIDNLQIMAD